MEFTSITNRADTIKKGIYADTPQNRKIGRVGFEYDMKKEHINLKEYKVFHETLSGVIETLESSLPEGIELDPEERDSILDSGGISYETTVRGSHGILVDGKKVQRRLQFQIYRTSRGRYELNAYMS